jgi:hypothetical protein
VNTLRGNELTPDSAIIGPDDLEVEESHSKISKVTLPSTDATSTSMVPNGLRSTFKVPELPLRNGPKGL